MKLLNYTFLAIAVNACAFQAAYAQNNIRHKTIDGLRLISSETITYAKTDYVLQHFLDESTQQVISEIYNSRGDKVSHIPDSSRSRQRVDPSLTKLLSDPGSMINENPESTLSVDILLKTRNVAWNEPYSTASHLTRNGRQEIRINGILGSRDGVDVLQDQYRQSRLASRSARDRELREIIDSLVSVENISRSNEVNRLLDNPQRLIRLKLNLNQIKIVSSEAMQHIAWIGILPEVEDTIANAMLETNVDPEALTRADHTGNGIGIYMTENGCAPNGEVPNYTWLGGTNNTVHARRVVGILSEVSPDSRKYCRTIIGGGPILPINADLDGVGGLPPIHIINRSNGGNSNRLYDPLSEAWDDFAYDNELATFVSAGNSGATNGNVISPALGLNIVSVGSYNDNNATIDGFSSFRDSTQTFNEKPEIVAPGNTIAVPNVAGAGQDGTSFSSPHAAAFAADLMESNNEYEFNPYLVKASMIAGARNIVFGAAEAVGEGGIDYLQHVNNGEYVKYWRGTSGTFDWLDTFTDGVDDEWFEHQFWLSSNYVDTRVALSWQLRGEYIGDNISSAQPMGSNYDFMIFDPNGGYVGGAFSYHDPYDLLAFDPDISGFYKIKIRRTSNGDSGAKFHLGYAVNWQ